LGGLFGLLCVGVLLVLLGFCWFVFDLWDWFGVFLVWWRVVCFVGVFCWIVCVLLLVVLWLVFGFSLLLCFFGVVLVFLVGVS